MSVIAMTTTTHLPQEVSQQSMDTSPENVDKLRTIRAFTESQLLSLYNNSQLDDNQLFVDTFLETNLRNNGNKLYELFVELEKSRERHKDINNKVQTLRGNCETLMEKVWNLENKTIVRNGRCSDNRTVKAIHKYNESTLSKDNLKQLDKTFLLLKESLCNDNCLNHYLYQFIRLEIENYLIHIINERDVDKKPNQLRTAISDLFAYQRRCLIIRDEELNRLTLNWLLNTTSEFLSIATFEDHLFVLNHVLRCAAGSSVQFACLIQCASPLSTSDQELAIQYMNHCITVISTILSPIKFRVKFIGIIQNDKMSSTKNLGTDEMWHLVDNDLNGEDVTSSCLEIAELDVIRFLKQVPFNDVLKFAAINKCSKEYSNSNSYGEATELQMLKLLAFSTKLIQILRQGLESFNCLRFKELTVYISSMIRRTVLAVSDLWVNCKSEFKSGDNAMILRLQVEFDHFMLRSIVAILTTKRQGVWNFLSVFSFDGVSEPMMWLILWVIYNNGSEELNDLGGVCPYFDVNQWKRKLNDVDIRYQFRQKLKSLALTESHNILQLLYNMAISRNESNEMDIISTIFKEIFVISLQSPELSENMCEKGQQLIVNSISRYNSLYRVLIHELILNDYNNDNEKYIELFCDLPLNMWNPDDEDMNLLTEWLTIHPIDHLFNRIARIIFSSLNWSYNLQNKELFIEKQKHQKLAIALFTSVNNQKLLKTPKDFQNSNYNDFGCDSLLLFAKSSNCNDFTKWVWNQLIVLKLQSLELSFENWDFIFDDNSDNNNNNNIIQLYYETNLIPLCKALEEQNSIAIYLAFIMTDFGQSKLTDKCVDSLEILLTNHHYLPFIHLLYTLIPYHLKQYEILLSNSKLLNLLSQLFANYSKETISLIYHQISRFSNQENKLKLIICWTELLFKVIITIAKANSNSWFNSCAKKFQQFGYIFEKIAIILYMDNELLGLYLKYLSEYQFDNQFLKIQNSGWMSSMFNLNSSSNKKYEFVTPLHVIYKQNATNVWLGWLIIQSDIIRFDKYWDQIVNDISDNPVITPEIAIKSISKKNSEQNISTDLLPINSLSILTMNSPSNPPNELEPYIWFKFFQFYFTNTQSNRSVGELFISEDKVKKLVNKLNSLVDYHLKQWLKCDANGSAVNDIDDNLTKLYRAYISWLEDSQLHEVFVNINELPPQYLKDILKCAISNTEFISFRHKYFSIKVIETSISEISNLWTQIHSTFNKFDVFVEDYYKSYAIENEEPLSAPEVKKSNLDSFNIDIETINNSSALLLLIQHNVRVILEEAKFFESLLNKFVDLNKKLVQLLPDLYPKIKKDIKLTATCDKDNYDAYGCAGPAVFNIEITEAIINQHSEKSIERNRIDFENIIIQLIETPSNKVVLASLFIEKSIPLLLDCYDFHDKDSQIERSLLGSLLSWINDTNYMYAPSKRMFTNLLESLETISEQRCDETNQFILETAINHPKMNEYMTPYLTPSKTSTKCFLDMYKMIDQKLLTTPPQVSFVLLSKFDVSLWFRNASPEQRLSLIQVVGNAINKFGHNPKDEYLMILELYRKHWKWMCEWSPLF